MAKQNVPIGLGACLNHHNFLIFGEPVDPINAGTSELASEIARRWNAHDRLVSALLGMLLRYAPLPGGGSDDNDDLRTARAALAAARGAS